VKGQSYLTGKKIRAELSRSKLGIFTGGAVPQSVLERPPDLDLTGGGHVIGRSVRPVERPVAASSGKMKISFLWGAKKVGRPPRQAGRAAPPGASALFVVPCALLESRHIAKKNQARVSSVAPPGGGRLGWRGPDYSNGFSRVDGGRRSLCGVVKPPGRTRSVAGEVRPQKWFCRAPKP